MVRQANEKKISDVGGASAWDALSATEQKEINSKTHRNLCIELGEKAFPGLSVEEWREIDFLIWAGCCMHKEMNSVKGGYAAMAAWWLEMDLPGPIKLMNKANATVANAGPGPAQDQAVDASQSGGVKLTSLAGAVFNHKDDKKGQQDTLRFFFEAKIGYMISFPDTSNTRYQSHCEAAAVLLLYLPLFIKFLELVHDEKDSGSFNYMEFNVYHGLQDILTLTELAVLVLYTQSISHLYMRQVRSPEQVHKNILDLGPLHKQVKTHCKKIIADPDLLLSPSASYVTGAMDGKLWEQPEAVYAVQKMITSLPHIQGALVTFFTSALQTWDQFTSEFAPEGDIANLSKEER